jgi:hypothetical protein
MNSDPHFNMSQSLLHTLSNFTHARMSEESRSKASRCIEGSNNNRKGPSPSKLWRKIQPK